ncbi:MAG: recombinase [Lachnospiraceae bacterium]|nr:recombinase [Lachnospiraceae bacterium]
MGHTPYGYKIVNGLAVIDEVEGAAVKKLYEGYLGGLGLQAAADEAEISINHCQAKRMMLNKKYLGTDYYPALITEDMMEKVKTELTKRAGKLGRVYEPKEQEKQSVPTRFQFGKEEQCFENPFLQAQYMYELIEGV